MVDGRAIKLFLASNRQGFLDSTGTDRPLFLLGITTVVKEAWLPRIWSCATTRNPGTPQLVLVKDGFCLQLIFLV